MAELTLTTFLTLDGVMQAPGGPGEDESGHFPHGGWLVPHADMDMGMAMVEIFNKADAFLLGRNTYDVFAGHWPKVTDPDNPVAVRLNSLPKHVASHTRSEFAWHNSSRVKDVVEEVAELKAKYPREVQVHGSWGLAQTLIENDLIDEYRLITFPVLLGAGKRLFGGAIVPSMLRLVASSATSKGAIISTYRRGGALVTGSFALQK